MTTATKRTHLSATELASASGCTYRQIESWTDAGYLLPVPPEHPLCVGSGYHRIYTSGAVQVAALIGLCSRSGLTPKAIAPLAHRLLAIGRADIELGPWRLTLRLTRAGHGRKAS